MTLHQWPQVYGGAGLLGAGGRRADESWWLSGGVSPSDVVAAYQPRGAASLAASYVNLANPGMYDAIQVIAPTLEATGWGFDSNSWLNVPYPAPYDQSHSVLVRYTTPALSNNFLCGRTPGSGQYAISLRSSANPNPVFWNGGGLFRTVGTSGVIGISGNLAFVGGVQQSGTIPTNPAVVGAYGYGIGAANNNGSRLLAWTGTIAAIAIYSTTLTAPQVAAISAAMAAL